MTTTDINLSAEQVCSTERAHERSPKIQGTRYVAPMWQLKFSTHSFLDIPWRPHHLLLSPDYSKTRPRILNSILFSLYLAGSVLLFDNFFILSKLLDYNTYKYKHGRNTNAQSSSMRHERGENTNFQIRGLFLWKAHLKYWSGTTITPTPMRLSARSWC